jgi:hypothetical protein
MVSQGFLQHRQEIKAVQTPLVQGKLVLLKLLFSGLAFFGDFYNTVKK